MPTGYTSQIADGISFEDFTLQCARAFGACVMQRDDSMSDKPKVPDRNDYHEKRLKESQKELARFKKLTKAEKSKRFDKEKEKTRKSNEKEIRERLALKKKYDGMLKKVRSWEPPTPSHEGLKDFMVRQIEDSIEFDCSTVYPNMRIKELEKWTLASWEKILLESLNRDIEYHTKESKEQEAADGERANWIIELYKSLGITYK